MILCDNNIQLLITNNSIRLLRSNSALKYNINSYEKEPIPTFHGIVRAYDTKIYEYIDNSIINHKINEIRLFSIGPIVDFFKIESEFFFIKHDINSTCLVNSNNKKIVDGFELYYVYSNCFFYLVYDSDSAYSIFFCIDLLTLKKKIIHSEKDNKIFKFIANDDYLIFADKLNKIHVKKLNSGDNFYDEMTTIVYHYHSNKILKLSFCNNYIISVGKDGKIVRFGLKNHEQRLLFMYDCDYVSMKIFNNRIYLLTTSIFKVYDCSLENEIYKEILPSISKYRRITYAKILKEENDVFKNKKTSTIAIECDEIHNEEDNDDSCVGLINGNCLFLVSNNKNIVIHNLNSYKNFLANNKIISLKKRKSYIDFYVYDICKDQLIFSKKFSLRNINIDDFYFYDNCFYYKDGDKIFKIDTTLKITELVLKIDESMKICDLYQDFLLINLKGIYDICKGKYILKQSKVSLFCIVEENILFYIRNQGLYIDRMKKKPLIDLNILDVIYEEGYVKILYISDNASRVVGYYKLIENTLVKHSEEKINNNCTKFIYKSIFENNHNQLIIKN